MPDIYDAAEEPIREDGRATARAVMALATHDPTLALAILGCAVDAVLETIHNHDERHSLLIEFIECLQGTPNA